MGAYCQNLGCQGRSVTVLHILSAGAANGAEKELWWGIEAWRWMFLAGVVPAVIYGLVSMRLPESP